MIIDKAVSKDITQNIIPDVSYTEPHERGEIYAHEINMWSVSKHLDDKASKHCSTTCRNWHL